MKHKPPLNGRKENPNILSTADIIIHKLNTGRSCTKCTTWVQIKAGSNSDAPVGYGPTSGFSYHNLILLREGTPYLP